MDIISQPYYDVVYEEAVEEWIKKKPSKSNHIRVSRGLYCHHGIYISDEEVIHFTGNDGDSVLDWSKPEVITSDLNYFLKDGVLESKEYTAEELKDLYPTEHIVQYAKACLGDKGYNLIFNNCEHFANICTLGRFRSNQVSRLFNAIIIPDKLPQHGGINMGLLSTIGGAIKSIFGGGSSGNGGSRSTSSTSYEPDKVKVAEIEADTNLRLAGMENERIVLMKNARLELLEFETQSNIALEEAKAKGLNFMAQTIIGMQDRLNEVAEKRLQIIEKGSLQIIKEIESFYNELGDKIKADDDVYNTDKLPQLLSLLEKYEIGTPSHDLYRKRIEDDMMLQAKHYTMQIDAASKRQSQIISGFLQSKDRIVEQTGQITADILKNIVGSYSPSQSLNCGTIDQPMIGENKVKLLNNGSTV
jgi:hypothetical protein